MKKNTDNDSTNLKNIYSIACPLLCKSFKSHTCIINFILLRHCIINYFALISNKGCTCHSFSKPQKSWFYLLWLLPTTDWMHLFGNRYSVDGRKLYVPTKCEPFSDRIFMVCECDSCKSGECLHGEPERFSTPIWGPPVIIVLRPLHIVFYF